MNKISFSQLACLLFVSRIFAEAHTHFTQQNVYGMQRFTALLLSFVLLLAVSVPLLVFLHFGGEKSAVAAIREKSRILGVLVGALILVQLLSSSLSTLVHLEYYASSTIFTSAPMLLVIIFPVVCALYALRCGIESTARAGAVVFAAFCALIGLVFFSTLRYSDFSRLYPAFADTPDTLLSDVGEEFSKNAEPLVLLLLCGNVRKKAHRSLWIYLPAVLAATELMNLMYMTVLGHYFDSLIFPFYTLASLSDIVLLQRLDGIDAVVWTMAAIVRLSVFALAAAETVRNGLGLRRAAAVTAGLFVLLIPLAAYFCGNEAGFVKYVISYGKTGIPLAVIIIITSVAAIASKPKRRDSLETH